MCGIALPPGLTDGSRLPEPIFTPATKAAIGDHDENVDYDRVVATVGADLAARLRDTSIAIYSRAEATARERGIILADTKFEFGLVPGEPSIVLADEVLTPDSSRYWPADPVGTGPAATVVRQAVRAGLARVTAVRMGQAGDRTSAAPARRDRGAHPRQVHRGLRTCHRTALRLTRLACSQYEGCSRARACCGSDRGVGLTAVCPHHYAADMLPSVLAILAGLVLLVAGGEVLVRGASNIAASIGMSPLVVGLTVVSFATSAPEFAVTMQSVTSGSPGLAVGNVVGSNIANILLVLGIAAIITPLAVKSRVVRFDVPVMIGLSVIVTVMALNGVIARWQGAVLLAILVVYVVWTVRIGRSDPEGEREKLDPEWIDGELRPDPVPERSARNMLASGVMVVVGIALLVFGASVLVSGATTIASALGLSDLVIGLTIVAIGTSLPELATSVVAALRGERDLAVGNAVGSSIFNLGAVLGFAALLSPEGIVIPEGAQNLDFLLMTGVAILLLPVVYTGYAVGRWEGILFVVYYVAYTTYLLLMSADHDSLAPFSTVMLIFVIPLTFMFLIVLAVAEHSRRSAGPSPAAPEVTPVE